MDIKLPGGAVDPGGGEPAIQRTNPGAADERQRKTGYAADGRYKKAACRGEGGTQVRLLLYYSSNYSAMSGFGPFFWSAGFSLHLMRAEARTPQRREILSAK